MGNYKYSPGLLVLMLFSQVLASITIPTVLQKPQNKQVRLSNHNESSIFQEINPPDIYGSEGTIIIIDNNDPDCTPSSGRVTVVLDGNYFEMQEGHYYCKMHDGGTTCYLWDGEQLRKSWPSLSACRGLSDTWCHGFTDVDDQPCSSLALSSDGALVCTGPESISVSASVPCMIVQRWPYPRGMVDLENEFNLLGPLVSERGRGFREAWGSRMHNYLLEVEWRMMEDVEPLWAFDERSWSDEPDTALGFNVTHTYQTSSWEKPENGPSLDGRLELPAYQVYLYTQWVPWVHRRYEYTVSVNREFACTSGDFSCINQRIQCEITGYDSGDPACHTTKWRTYDSGWVPIDLRDYGARRAYYTSSAAVDITRPPGDISPVPDSARVCGAIPVPVIEVQVYLNAP